MRYNEDLIRIIDERIAAGRLKSFDFGTVQDRDTTGPGATVVFDGSPDAAPVKVPGHVHCFGGDRVVLVRVKGTWVVLGTFNRRQLSEAFSRFFGPTTAATYAGATFADQPAAATISFKKRYDLTATRFELVTNMSVSVTPTNIATAVRVAGAPGTDTALTYTPTDFVITQQVFNQTGHFPVMGSTRTPAIPSGDYTITARWRRISGTGNLTQDGNDAVNIEVDEIFRTTEV